MPQSARFPALSAGAWPLAAVADPRHRRVRLRRRRARPAAASATATPCAASPARRERVLAAGAQLDDLVLGDATTGAGLDAALDGVDVAYYLIHSMEGSARRRSPTSSAGRPRPSRAPRPPPACAGSSTSAACCRPMRAPSRHLASRLAVEQALLAAAPESVALRASIVVAARSRSFRFLVRLIERLPVLALPAWRVNRTQPVDGRDVLEFLAAAATLAAAPHRPRLGHRRAGRHELPADAGADRRGDADRPARDPLPFNLTPVASVVAAAVAEEDPGLIEPLMESLEHDLLPRDDDAAAAFGVRLHRFEAAVERALRDMEGPT